MKRKTNFVLGGDIEEALRNLASLNGAPVTKKVNDSLAQRGRAVRKPYAAHSQNTDLYDWLKSMKPTSMGRWNWLVLVHWQVCHAGPKINLDSFAEALDIKKDKVNAALNDLAKSDLLHFTDEERDESHAIVSRTVELKLGDEWGTKTIFS